MRENHDRQRKEKIVYTKPGCDQVNIVIPPELNDWLNDTSQKGINKRKIIQIALEYLQAVTETEQINWTKITDKESLIAELTEANTKPKEKE